MRDALRRGVLRCVALLRSRTLDRDLDDELAAHLALAEDDYRRRGLAPEAARRQARVDLGGALAARERHREARGLQRLEGVFQDVAYALRTIGRTRGSSLIAVLILALGIGVNTAVFSVVRPLMLSPLPFPDAEDLVWIAPGTADGRSVGTYPISAFEELERRNRVFADMSAYWAYFGFGSFTLTGQGQAENVGGTLVAPRFFETLGVQPVVGRLFAADEAEPSDAIAVVGPSVVLVSHGLWQRRFGGDPNLVGTTIAINGFPSTVIGVLPADFNFSSVFAPTTSVDLFAPIPLDAARATWGSALSVVARLKPGVSLDAASADIDRVLRQVHEDAPDDPELSRVTGVVTSLHAQVSGRFERSLSLLWGVVAGVLLIACANLSNLLMARTMARTREIGVRLALGAGRARVVRQLLVEGVLLALLGAAAGVPMAYGIVGAVSASTTLDVPLLDRVAVDGWALLFTVGLAATAGVASMTLSALRVSGQRPAEMLKAGTPNASDGRVHASLRSALLVGEVALACVLLVGGGLLTRSLVRVLSLDLGFAPSHVTTARLNTSSDWSPEGRARRDGILADLLARVRQIPGVEAAGVSDALPLDRSRAWAARVPGVQYPPDEAPVAFVYVTGPGYLSAMGIRLSVGRDFSSRDVGEAPHAVIVNEVLARRLWPGDDPIGRELQSTLGRYQVVGVVAPVRQARLEASAVSQMYLPYTQAPPGAMDLVVRSALPAASLARSLRATLAAVDPDLLASDVRPMDDLIDRAVSPRRFLARAVGAFSLLALVLASVGVYGVGSYVVGRRTREIGIRMALGATATDIQRQMLAGSLRLAAIGTAIGAVSALASVRLLSALLYDTSPFDPFTFVGAAGLLLVVAAAAAYVPARRAARCDPLCVLRAQ